MPDNQESRMTNLGREVLEEVRVQLMMAYRFMDAALWRMDFSPISISFPLSTSGRKLFFEPSTTLIRYRETPNELVRDYLHCILHCIFRHPYDSRHFDIDAWWLATDIAVESIAVDIAGKQFPSDEDLKRRKAMEELRDVVGELTPNKIYNAITKARNDREYRSLSGLGEDVLWDYRKLFERDNHEFWPTATSNDEESSGDSSNDDDDREEPEEGRPDDTDEDGDGGEMDGFDDSPEDDDTDDSDDSDEKDDTDGNGDADSNGNDPTDPDSGDPDQKGEGNQDDSQGDDSEGGPENKSEDQLENGSGQDSSHGGDSQFGNGDIPPLSDEDEQAKRDWDQIGKQMEVDLEAFSENWGSESGALEAVLKIANRKTVDYREFLRKFSKVMEEVKINDEDFDYIFYKFGLDHYGNMPLVEPLEYQEVKRIRDFVIAIDTSESCSGETVKKFLRKTYEILKESEGFGRKVNVHIVQCDAVIQSDVKIESLEDMKEYSEDFVVRGFGGTDFRPVFEYVDRLVRSHEIENLQGLIYFTDGMGTYPKKMPEYDTAFVFIDEGPGMKYVPAWAMKVIIDEERIREL